MNNDKIKEIQNKLQEKDIDFLIIPNLDEKSKDINYLTNYPGHGLMIVPKSEKSTLFTSKMEYNRAKSKFDGTKLFKKDIKTQINNLIRPKQNVAIAISNVNAEVFNRFSKYDFKITDFSQELKDIKATKTEEEISRIKKACNITDKIFAESLIKSTIKSESELKRKFEVCAAQFGCKTSFDTIVASGKGAATPHYDLTRNKISKGFCIIDFGIYFKGYTSDVTRTIFIGSPTKKEKETYDNLRRIQEETILQAKEGVKFHEVDGFARRQIGPDFITALGHGFGMDVHEQPYVGPNSKDKVTKNMTFTIEPGVYVQNKYGIRIEDDIVIRNKPVVLNKFTKDLLTFN